MFSDTFLFLFFIVLQELVNVVFCSLNLLHIFLNLTIFTVQLFLFCKDLGILCTEIFYLRKLPQMKLIKGILGSLMKQDFLSVLFQEFLAISTFTIIRIYDCLGYLLCIKVLGKADIIFSFALSQLLLNIDKKVKLMIFLFSQVSLWLLFGFFIIVESMLHLTGKNLLKVFFCITITQ